MALSIRVVVQTQNNYDRRELEFEIDDPTHYVGKWTGQKVRETLQEQAEIMGAELEKLHGKAP